jgi:hypothetical protein
MMDDIEAREAKRIVEQLANELGSLHKKDQCHKDVNRCHTCFVLKQGWDYVERVMGQAITQMKQEVQKAQGLIDEHNRQHGLEGK